MTLLVDLREVDAARAAATVLSAKGLVAGASVEQATGADGVRVARVRIRLTQPAAHQVRSKRNVIYVDLDSAFPLGSVGAASPGAVPAPADPRFATLLESVRAEAKPTGASITLSGNGELVAESVTPFGDGTPRVVLDFPNVRSQTPPDVFVGRGPCLGRSRHDDRCRADDPRRRGSPATGKLSRYSSGRRREELHDSVRGHRAGRVGGPRRRRQRLTSPRSIPSIRC